MRPDTLLRLCSLLLAAAPLACREAPPPPAAAAPDPAYVEEVEAWRAEREEGLRQADGWLTLAGLYWLEEGDNAVGSDPGSDLVFPAGSPERIGVLRLEEGRVTLAVEPGVPVTHEGEPVAELTLAPDTGGDPTVLELGSLRFHLIERAGRLGIRLKDLEHPALAAFTGLDYFPIDPAWRIEARFEAYEPPKTIRVPNVIGSEFEQPSPGAVVFTAGGREHRLEPTGEAGGDLFLVFGDATNGEETYGGGRFLVIPAPEDGTALVDFNRAYNPPCVFTPYATCPLPPRQNRLPIPVPAGEKVWGDGGAH